MNDNDLGQHISHQYDQELEDVKNKVLQMGGLVENQLTNALKALMEQDSDLAEEVAYSDYKVNDMEVKIDEECAQIIARRQPAASDLRLILTIIKAITDLERIGDEAEKIARYAVKTTANNIGSGRTHASLRNLSEHVKVMLREALDAFARMDVEQAMRVATSDKRIDSEFDNLSRLLLTRMMEDPRNIPHCMNVTWCARSLERIGDHSKNLCEYVVYLVKGKDVRHTSLEKVKEALLLDQH